MNLIKKDTKSASVALTTVVLLSGILLVTAVAIVISNLDISMAIKNVESFNIAKLNTFSCIEESIYKLKFEPTFTGNIVVNDLNDSCTAVVSNDANPNYKTITSTSNTDGTNYTTTITVDISMNPFEIIQ